MLLTFFIIYVLFALTVMIFQRRLIYFPSRFAPESAESLALQEGFQPWRNKTGEVIGWQIPATGTPTGAVLIIHGNAGSAFHRNYLAQPIHDAASVNVYVLEYPGYGARPGSPSQESILRAAEDAFDLLTNQSPVYVVAESLGTGAAAHLARQQGPKVAGLLFVAPYDNLVSIGQRQMPFLPVGLLMRDRFNPGQWLQDYRGPIKVVLAEADTIIPSKFGQRLFDRYQGPKTIEIVPGVGHNDIASQSPDWWRNVFSFWEQNRQK